MSDPALAMIANPNGALLEGAHISPSCDSQTGLIEASKSTKNIFVNPITNDLGIVDQIFVSPNDVLVWWFHAPGDVKL